MDDGRRGFGKRLLLCGRRGAFGMGDFVDAAEALSRQLRVFHVAGSALSAGIRPVRNNGLAVGFRQSRFDHSVFGVVFTVFHHGDAQYRHHAFVGRGDSFDTHDRLGNRFGHRNFPRPLLFTHAPSASAACACKQTQNVAVERLDVGVFARRSHRRVGLSQNRTPLRPARSGSIVYIGGGFRRLRRQTAAEIRPGTLVPAQTGAQTPYRRKKRFVKIQGPFQKKKRKGGNFQSRPSREAV